MSQPRPFFYSVALLQGAGLAVDVLDAEDPFSLSATEIVERLLAMGCNPIVDSVQRDPFPQYGTTHEVERDGSTFLVAVSRDAELISVQEVRAEHYNAE